MYLEILHYEEQNIVIDPKFMLGMPNTVHFEEMQPQIITF